MKNFDKNRLVELLDSLKKLPHLKEVKALRKRIQQELTKLEQAIEIEMPSIPMHDKTNANENRRSKLLRYWRYVKLIRDNYPDYTTSEIRRQLKERQQGKEVDIPDAIWQNPSV